MCRSYTEFQMKRWLFLENTPISKFWVRFMISKQSTTMCIFLGIYCRCNRKLIFRSFNSLACFFVCHILPPQVVLYALSWLDYWHHINAFQHLIFCGLQLTILIISWRSAPRILLWFHKSNSITRSTVLARNVWCNTNTTSVNWPPLVYGQRSMTAK